MTTPSGQTFNTCIVYLRCSTERQMDSGLGMEADETSCRRYADEQGLEIAAIFRDEAISSGLPMDERPALVEALQAIKPGMVLLVAKRDRMARNYIEAGIIDTLVAKSGGKVVSAMGEGTDGDADDPNAFLLRAMHDILAQYERMRIRMRVKGALAVKKARGERLGATPYGYTTVPSEMVNGKRQPGTVVINETEQAAKQMARELRAEGLTVRAIADRLNEAGYRTKRGSEWKAGNTARLLEDNYIERNGGV